MTENTADPRIIHNLWLEQVAVHDDANTDPGPTPCTICHQQPSTIGHTTCDDCWATIARNQLQLPKVRR